MEGWWPEKQSRQREHMAKVPEAVGSRVHEELEDGMKRRLGPGDSGESLRAGLAGRGEDSSFFLRAMRSC